jgi:hypothetical protein
MERYQYSVKRQKIKQFVLNRRRITYVYDFNVLNSVLNNA